MALVAHPLNPPMPAVAAANGCRCLRFLVVTVTAHFYTAVYFSEGKYRLRLHCTLVAQVIESARCMQYCVCVQRMAEIK